MLSGEDFLQKFKLNTLRPSERDAIASAASRIEKRTGESINHSDTAALIQNYISRFREILDRENPKKRERGLENLKRILHEQFLIKSENIPNSYYESIKKRHREEGHGEIKIPDDLKNELASTAVEDQRRSLDAWIDYLASDDAKYPDELKYWTFRSILKMGRFDKGKRKFTNREGKGSVTPFPELNREALAVIMEDMEKKYDGKSDYSFTSRYDIGEAEKMSYRNAIGKENFSDLYALSIDAFKPIAEELLQETAGEWLIYPKGSNPKLLVDSIADYGTGWCLRGEPTARRYIENNDLHVYYSNDKEGHPVVPRVVMVINQANQITEVRGIEAHEHLDSHILPVVEVALAAHPDGKQYRKKSDDMKRLTAIERSTILGQPLTKADLLFLYEVDSRIEGFGYENAGRDPRIAELRLKRNVEEDMPIVFGCRKEHIAREKSDITPSTKAYVGSFAEGFFRDLPSSLDHIYTSFPEGRIRLQDIDIGGRTAEEYETTLKNAGFKISDYAKSMLQNKDQFITPVNAANRKRHGNTETIHTVLVSVRDLGFPSGATTKDIFARAESFGLELCPPETGPSKRLQDKLQPMNDWYRIGMKPITGSGGRPRVFGLARRGDGLWLCNSWAREDDRWSPDLQFLFQLRKSDTDKL